MIKTYKIEVKYNFPIFEKSIYSENGCYIVEYNIHHFWKQSDYGDWISPHNRKFYRIRRQHHNKSVLWKTTYNKRTGNLNTYFKVTPTYKGGNESITTINIDGTTNKTHKFYTIMIQFQKLKSLIGEKDEWTRLNKKDKEDIAKLIINQNDVKFHSNDPSYLYQGTWKLVNDLGAAVHPFPNGLEDKGIWLAKHGNNGRHLGKHFLNVFPTLKANIDGMVDAIDKEYRG